MSRLPSASAEPVEPNPEQAQALEGYLSLLLRWNATYNLTAVRNREQMRIQHLADCLALIGPLRRRLEESPARRLLDVGSGAGLPGVVVAIMQPDMEVICVDAVGKKAAFVRQVAAEVGLRNLRSEHARVELLQSAGFDLIVSRAFASLRDFVERTRRLLSPGGAWIAMKGQSPVAEIEALPSSVTVFHVEPLRVPQLDADRCLVWMRVA